MTANFKKGLVRVTEKFSIKPIVINRNFIFINEEPRLKAKPIRRV